jgi:hypothetical protein
VLIALLFVFSAPPTPDPEAERLRIAVEVAIAIAKAKKPALPKVDPAPGDPYGSSSYAEFQSKIARGMRGVLVIGIPDKWFQSYQLHYRVESGTFPGWPDGDYDCWLDSRTGELKMQPRKEVAPKSAVPFLPGTVVPRAGTSLRPEQGRGSFEATTGMTTYTLAPYVVSNGSTTNCGPVG